MKIYNKTFIIITITYLVTLVCLLFGLIQSEELKIILVILLIPLLILWAASIRLSNQIKALNIKIIESTKINAANGIQRITQHDIAALDQHINSLLSSLRESKEYTALIKASTEALAKENDDLSKKLVTKKVLSHTVSVETETKKPTNTIITNHIIFNEFINKSISSSKRKNKLFALMIVCINRPDSSQPDLIAKSTANEISTILRSDDIIARFEDEIFIVLSDIGKPKFASIVAEKILGITKKMNAADPSIPPLSTNIGICTFPDDGDKIESLFENAANALYKSIQLGKHNYEFHSDKLNVEAKEYIQLESALKNAIHNHEVTLYYQPKLELKTATITGVEALMRWEHPILGIINPDKFITISEETGSFMKIAEIALRDACVMNKSWQDQGLEHITVSVNISPKQFHHPDLPSLIIKATTAAGLNPAYLELEISESTIMGDIKQAESTLEKLKVTGVKISIDHFGTGFTSISMLKKFPINTIKIDRSFIAGIPNNPNDISITNAFISLAHNLSIQVVAEGVETAEQVQHLITQHCDLIQGFFLSHPLHASKISSQLKKLNEEVEI